MEILIFCVQRKRNQMNLFSIISSYISVIISLCMLDITDNKGDLMVFVRSHIPSRLNHFKIPSNMQIIPFEINLRKEKQLVASIYNAPSQKNKYFLWYLTNLIKFYSTRYEKVIILGDFNIEPENKVKKDFLWEHTFYNMMKQNTCFKGDGGSCIDLLITNLQVSLIKTNSFETGLSDHHHVILRKFKKLPYFRTARYEAMKPIFPLFNAFQRAGICQFTFNLIQDGRSGEVQKDSLIVSLNTF